MILSANDQVLESMSLWGDISRLSLSTADYASLEGEGARWGKSTHTTSFNEQRGLGFLKQRVAAGVAARLPVLISKKVHLLLVAQVGDQGFDVWTSWNNVYPNHSTVGFLRDCKCSKKEMEG